MENKVATLEELSAENYGFKWKHHPIQSIYLETFEKDLFNMANSLKFRRLRNYFQQKMKEDIAQIKSSNDVFIFANKTKSHHQKNIKKLLFNNRTKSCRKSTKRLEKAINMEAKQFSQKLTTGLDNRIECLAKILRLYR